MAWQIKVETKEDLEHLKNLFEGSVEKINRGTSRFSDDLAAFVLRFWDAIEAAEETDKTSSPPKAKAVPKKRAPRGTKFKPNLCSVHPEKALLRAPTTDCKGCWDAYKRLHPLDYEAKRRTFERKQRSAE